jgi:hypothetical protein
MLTITDRTATMRGSAFSRSLSALGHLLGVSGALDARHAQKRLKPTAFPTRIPTGGARSTLSGRGDREEKHMTLFEQTVASARIDDLDAALAPLQDMLGVTDGGASSHFFSGPGFDHEGWPQQPFPLRVRKLVQYIGFEMSNELYEEMR